ncbi:FHA domain-containing protein [Acinetobacter sp. ANC 4641]|uniref:FHA domain-containing protein n=1 Tax=Acinetobacter sp. ANC 4641 TaxID=2529847 RepID=UPI00103886D3|nr:FHA domain-containing protein [Acinetobacter sp. ANC 4641]TCB13106.1 FHA domain-containing protein [Acinetobacter sp. ANC 4641]
MSWILQAISDELQGQEVEVKQDMLVGRHQDCDLVLQSSAISRRHAAFSVRDEQLWLTDLNSSNGTFVNDARIAQETLLTQGDIVQFANLKFALLAENADLLIDENLDIAAGQTAADNHAQKMNEQGMPSLTERSAETAVNHEGMPQHVAVPKPAPIPEGVDPHAKAEPTPIPVEQPVSRVEQEVEQQKNVSVGLMTIIVIIILAVLAFVFFK